MTLISLVFSYCFHRLRELIASYILNPNTVLTNQLGSFLFSLIIGSLGSCYFCVYLSSLKAYDGPTRACCERKYPKRILIVSLVGFDDVKKMHI